MADESATATQMQAWKIGGPGVIPDSLKLTNIPRPTASSLGKQDILVDVSFAGLNPADWKTVEMYLARLLFSFPKTPGIDFSGHVLAVGQDVTDIAVGDRVMGRTSPFGAQGSLQKQIVVPIAGVARLPDGVSMAQAGAIGTACLTAYQTIAPYVKAGDKVFINGGSGGTGSFGIQVAKALGCHVTVSCSTGKIPLCKELGADEIIDYKTTDVVKTLQEKGPVFALAVDNVGNSPADLVSHTDSYLRPEGTYKHVGGNFPFAVIRRIVTGTTIPHFLGGPKHKLFPYVTADSHENLTQIAQWMAEGKLKSAIDSVHGFAEVPKAYERLKENTSAGKVMVNVNGEDEKYIPTVDVVLRGPSQLTSRARLTRPHSNHP